MKKLTQILSILSAVGLITAAVIFYVWLGIWGRSFFLFIVVNAIAVFCTTVYLHRCVTHGSLKMKPIAAWCNKLGTFITTGVDPREWAGAHRLHHRYTDVEGDIHSPLLKGIWHILLFNFWYYLQAIKGKEAIDGVTQDIIAKEDWWDRKIFKKGFLGPIIGIGILCLLLGPVPGLIVAACHAILFVFVQNALINGLGHYPHFSGYQNKIKVQHAITTWNNWFIAQFTGGEAFHYNHHWKQRSAKLSVEWYEFDQGWLYICYLRSMGLAYDIRT